VTKGIAAPAAEPLRWWFGLIEELERCFEPGDFEEIERELDLISPSEPLRQELVLLLLNYRAKHNTGQPSQAALSQRVAKLGASARKLLAELRPLEDATARMPEYAEAAALWPLLERAGVDVEQTIANLKAICAFSERHRSKGGPRPHVAWGSLMTALAVIYLNHTGKRATITEDPYRHEGGGRYAGSFVNIAVLVDAAAAAAIGAKPKPANALGRSLRRLIETPPSTT
jgi:hypothetical protein